RANPACSSCHRMIDPLGLALENFDVTGAWRTLDRTASISDAGTRIRSVGVPIDTKTTLFDGTAIDGPSSLRQAIAGKSDAVIENLTVKLAEYALGRRIEYYNMPTIRMITHEAAKNNNRFSSLIMRIVKSAPFQMSTAEPASTDAVKN